MFELDDINSTEVQVTKEQKQSTIAALLHERLGYERRAVKAEEDGNEEAFEEARAKVAGCDAELKKLGHAAQKPAARTEKRNVGGRSVGG